MIGVVSHGLGMCASEDKPAMYTDVYEYLGWIKDNLALIGLFNLR